MRKNEFREIMKKLEKSLREKGQIVIKSRVMFHKVTSKLNIFITSEQQLNNIIYQLLTLPTQANSPTLIFHFDYDCAAIRVFNVMNGVLIIFESLGD